MTLSWLRYKFANMYNRLSQHRDYDMDMNEHFVCLKMVARSVSLTFYDTCRVTIYLMLMECILAAETLILNTETRSQQRLIVYMMIFAMLHPGFSLTVVQRYPYWLPYLPSTDSTKLYHKLQAPIDVWPARLFENYTQLRVMWVQLH